MKQRQGSMALAAAWADALARRESLSRCAWEVSLGGLGCASEWWAGWYGLVWSSIVWSSLVEPGLV
eukprot:CAMPEP_0184511602 /NCGR_PEP_ID=MMETSP0198_2-20121128/2438_1 /TAXON_ID=1112570 /ORGANISM="Thraustochytrium sp., Strain LLF1b" /LENGTH=65 /DNA_ID=CAMNT_0026901577 /DNA_START=520 /DNA_END=717 /DNA_ORIENTATION=-